MKKANYKQVYTGNWNCMNEKSGKRYNTTVASLQMPQGTPCKLKCNVHKEMAVPKKHGEIVCGRRGWHRQEFYHYIFSKNKCSSE